ncbi:hypothetical protein F5Y15DRAFT_230544 [Xylariaceae sp. FL0016]|nr:hypothetical protein F5Y15DRAFT_230544 [Xylariaceae sp. FL0016]
MTGRRQSNSHHYQSAEPADRPATRQTRSSARNAHPMSEPAPERYDRIPQRGTRRTERNKSIELPEDPKSSGEVATPEPEAAALTPVSESVNADSMQRSGLSQHDTAIIESTEESPVETPEETLEERENRISDLLEFDLPKFDKWCIKLYAALEPIALDSTEGIRKRLDITKKSFNQARRPFAEDDVLCIPPIALTETYSSEEQDRVRNTICSGNLMSLLASVVDILFQKKSALPILQQLDDAFPTSFDTAFQAQSAGIDEAFDLAFRIRCRHLLEKLVHHPNSDPFRLAADVFCTEPAKTAKKARQVLIDGPHKPLATVDVDDDGFSIETFQPRIVSLVKLLSQNSEEARQVLENEYPAAEFYDTLCLWAKNKYEQLNNINTRQQASEHSASSKERRQRVEQHEEQEESEQLFVDQHNSADHEHDNDVGGEDGNEVVDNDEANSDSGSDSDASEYRKLPEQSSIPSHTNQSVIDGSRALAAVRKRERQASERPRASIHHNTQKGKQPVPSEAEAIRALDPSQILKSSRLLSSVSENPVSTRQLASTAPKRSFPHAGVDDDDSEDDDFEVNEQLRNEQRRNDLRRVRSRNSTDEARRPKRIRYYDQSPEPSKLPQSSRITGSQNSGDDQIEIEGDDSEQDGKFGRQEMRALSQAAQANRRQINVMKPRQVRTPWSPADIRQLLELIADPDLNCSWSSMEKIGHFETPRNQQALRDKARHLKVMYLLGDMHLPHGFNQVALGRKEIEQVQGAGRNPDRKEDDLDQDGETIINQYWV